MLQVIIELNLLLEAFIKLNKLIQLFNKLNIAFIFLIQDKFFKKVYSARWVLSQK